MIATVRRRFSTYQTSLPERSEQDCSRREHSIVLLHNDLRTTGKEGNAMNSETPDGGAARFGDAFGRRPTGPLAGLVVADVSRVLAGPYCTMLLADMGATVVKVEGPGGDETRN